jgi:ubiquinone biosynthesis protein UbiJ
MTEAEDYVKDIDGVDTGLYQAYEIYPLDGDIPDGAEVFSLMRSSELDPESYIARYFSTGDEHEELS